jgi:hypothetical protein
MEASNGLIHVVDAVLMPPEKPQKEKPEEEMPEE